MSTLVHLFGLRLLIQQ